MKKKMRVIQKEEERERGGRHRETDRQIVRQTGREITESQKDRKKQRQRDGNTVTQKGRKMERQKETESHFIL